MTWILECSPDRETEQGPFFDERKRASELADRIQERSLVWKQRAIRDNRRLDQFLNPHRIVCPVEPEGALTTGIITCNSSPVDARILCVPGAIFACALKPAVGKAALSSVTRCGLSRQLIRARYLVQPRIEKAARITGPNIGMRYSRFVTAWVSPPGKMNW